MMLVWDFDEKALTTRAEELSGGTEFPFQMMEFAGTVSYALTVAYEFAETDDYEDDESFGEGAWRTLSPEARGRVLAATVHEHFIADLELQDDDFWIRIWDEPTPETARKELSCGAV